MYTKMKKTATEILQRLQVTGNQGLNSGQFTFKFPSRVAHYLCDEAIVARNCFFRLSLHHRSEVDKASYHDGDLKKK